MLCPSSRVTANMYYKWNKWSLAVNFAPEGGWTGEKGENHLL